MQRKYSYSIFAFILVLLISLTGCMNTSNAEDRKFDAMYKEKLKKLVFTDKIMRYDELQKRLKGEGFEKSGQEIRDALFELCAEQPNLILSDAGGFITTSGMLKEPIYNLAFVGPHNATNNDPDASRGFKDETRNHFNSMLTNLEMGSRMLDMDLGKPTAFGNPTHYHRFVLYGSTNTDKSIWTIREFLNRHPNDIIIVKFSEFFYQADMANSGNRHAQMNFYLQKMKDYGILDQIYNYNNPGQVELNNVTDNINKPILMDMIGNNKRILLYVKAVNEGKMKYLTVDKGTEYSAPPDMLLRWASDSWINQPEDLTILEYFPNNKSAGDPVISQISNDGYRLYDIMKQIEDKFNGKRIVNYTILDFLVPNRAQSGLITLSATDAANRINLQRFGGGWDQYEKEYFYWADGPAGKTGDITSQLTNTKAVKNGAPLNNSNIVTDRHFFYGLNVNNYAGLSIESELGKTKDIRYYCAYFTGQGRREIPYTVYGRRNGQWQSLKSDIFRYTLGQTWYVADLMDKGKGIDAIKIVFSNEVTNDLHLAEIAVYDTTTNFIRKPVSGKRYRIANANSQILMSTYNNLTQNGTKVLQYRGWLNESGQQWTLRQNSDGTFHIINGNNMALEANNSSVYVMNIKDDNRQKWRLIDNGYTTNGIYNCYEIRNKASNKNLAIPHGSLDWGTELIQFDAKNYFDQRWFFIEVPEYVK